MTLHRPLAPGVAFTSAPEGLRAIHAAGAGGVIWRRAPLASFQQWIEGLDPAVLPRARVILRPEAARDAVIAASDSAGLPDVPERARLADDVAALADIFAELTRARWLRLRLDVIATNACRRFHIDRVTARLVCTYRGSGTQYGVSAQGDPAIVHAVPTGSPFVMRGTLWPGATGPELLHRSPPIKGTGETRLMLVLDPVTDPEEVP
ncbi:DUF1826 domain-containing protein [Limimaricola pyoseonensis]|uniref:DUF1826 domain-containing protein n=1 Tax=Limimaricola pyoseonensis TaxID=521013 RepID=A0A1G6ZZF6_9RHOB|nr:DUF1826 domain-containing protein [Limimaricola pyoseonensis]SDE08054.1 Protein of unknown function [Limimaricola pyoseonensis]